MPARSGARVTNAPARLRAGRPSSGPQTLPRSNVRSRIRRRIRAPAELRASPRAGQTFRRERRVMPLRDPILVRLLFVMLLVAAGCASGGRASYDAMARDFAVIETRARGADAHDERMFEAKLLERAALVRAVLLRNPSVESARQGWRAALARYRQAGAYEEPTVQASIAPLSVTSPGTRVGYEVGIRQPIVLGGKLDAQATLAAAEAEAVRDEYEAVRVTLALSASELYDDYAVAVRSLEIHAHHLELVAALKQSVVLAYESGRATAADSLQAEAELARLEYQKVVSETQRDVAIAQLNALLHRAPDAPLPPPGELSLRDSDPAPAADALAHRPEIAVAQARVRVADAKIQAAQSGGYPQLAITTSYNSMWDTPEHRWMAGFELSIPFQRERRHAAVDEASADRAASASAVEDITDRARAEIVVAARRVEEGRTALRLYEQRLVPVARDQIEAARAAFVASQTSFLAVIEAEHNLRSAELELQIVRGDLSKRLAELDRMQGRMPGLRDEAGAP
jgi:cobalt-zinc-cadmium efflux system outer membrane protein